MTTVSGRYVDTFAEATHALPDGMHMNADYPFMLPRVVSVTDGVVTIREGSNETSFPIRKHAGREVGTVEQSSSFERMFRGKPQKFTMRPFRDSGR